MSEDVFIDFNYHVPDGRSMEANSDRPLRLSITTVGLPPGRYVIDVVKQEDGSVSIGFVNEIGQAQLFRSVGDLPQD